MGCAGSSQAGAGHSPMLGNGAPDQEEVLVSTLDIDEVREQRLSIKFQAKELGSNRSSMNAESSRHASPFDKSKIGTHTRHGVMPGPRGASYAKINQDRGVVCWPFHGSYNEALLCVFDGHGPRGEKISEFCTQTLPELLECASTSTAQHSLALSRPLALSPSLSRLPASLPPRHPHPSTHTTPPRHPPCPALHPAGRSTTP